MYITRPARDHSLRALDELGIQLPRAENISRDILLKKGVRMENIHFLGESCLSTVDEAEAVRDTFIGDDCTILIVTSPYHVRRAGMIFRNEVPRCNSRILATPYEPYPRRWWTDQDSARNTLLELAKIVFYNFGGRFESSKTEISKPDHGRV